MLFSLLVALVSVIPLQVVAQKAPPPDSSQVTPTAVKPIDPKLHADVLTLIELSGSRQRMLDAMPQSLDDGVSLMTRQCPKCTPEFYAEFKKRMLAQMDPAPCLAASAEEYEIYFNDQDVVELISIAKAQRAGQILQQSEELRTKLALVMPKLIGEVVGRCSQIGAKLGAQVAAEITQDHPDYVKGPDQLSKP